MADKLVLEEDTEKGILQRNWEGIGISEICSSEETTISSSPFNLFGGYGGQ